MAAKIYILTTFVLLGVIVRVSNAGVISVFVSRLVFVETVNVVWSSAVFSEVVTGIEVVEEIVTAAAGIDVVFEIGEEFISVVVTTGVVVVVVKDELALIP